MRTTVTSNVRVITSVGEDTVRTILDLRRVSLPDSWRWEDEEELGAYYRETLADPKHIHLFLEEGGIPVGFLHAGPHDHFVEELREFQPAFRPDPIRYYVETLFIHPDHRSGHGFKRLGDVMIDEADLRGSSAFSMHARVGNGLSAVIQRTFRDMTTLRRRLPAWRFYGGEEETDYLEMTNTGERGIYVTLERARTLAAQRWADKALRSRVERDLGCLPPGIGASPRAVIYRTLITPDNECLRFFTLTGELGLSPLGYEFHEDIFFKANPDKSNLARLRFSHGRMADGLPIYSYFRVLDMEMAHRKPFSSLATFWGEGLVAFHHRLLERFAPPLEIVNFSAWLTAHGGQAADHYEPYLKLFLAHGVLCENFFLGGQETGFTRNVLLPAVERIRQKYGIKPLIVPLLDPAVAEVIIWWCHPAEVEAHLLATLGPEYAGHRPRKR